VIAAGRILCDVVKAPVVSRENVSNESAVKKAVKADQT
jgi:hypothetical protein